MPVLAPRIRLKPQLGGRKYGQICHPWEPSPVEGPFQCQTRFYANAAIMGERAKQSKSDQIRTRDVFKVLHVEHVNRQAKQQKPVKRDSQEACICEATIQTGTC